MPNYARLAASAKRQIAAAGVPITLTRKVTDDYDPTIGTADTFGASTFTGSGVRDQYALRDIDGTLIRAGDVRIYMVWDDQDPIPQVGEKLIMDGQTWMIVKPNPIKPGPIVLLYEIQARQ